VPIIKQILEALNIPVIEVNEFEADDVIGTLAKRAENEGYMTYMVTPDKDYMQLVTENISMYRPGRSGSDYELLGIPEVNRYFGIENPVQVIDILALWGDSSDNIPGAPGIGEKTAKELIAKYHSLENLLAHVHELKGKQKDSLTIHQQQVLLSRDLARINISVPVDLTFEQLRIRQWNEKRLMEIFRELEFKTLMNRLLQETKQQSLQGSLFSEKEVLTEQGDSVLGSIHSIPHQYHVIHDGPQLDELVAQLKNLKEFCFDTETTGLNTRKAELVGIAIAFRAHEAFYIPVPQAVEQNTGILNKLRPVFENAAIGKIGQNLKYDIQILMNHQVSVEGPLFDTMIAHYLIQNDLRHNLEYLAEVYLNYKMVPIEALIGKKGEWQKNMRDVEGSIIKEYAGEDADISWQLYHRLYGELQKKGLMPLALNVEMPLIKVLAEMEYAGFRISKDNLENYAGILKKDLQTLEDEIYKLSNLKFNINSPKQLGEVLFQRMKIAEGTQKTRTNQYSTGEEVLTKLADKHPIIPYILDYRAAQKLLNTYVEALPVLIDQKTGRIHTSFDQAWVSTGRLSSRNPNLQNIPVRDERGKEIRRAFVAADDQHVLLSADYSQIELRLMAHLSQDPNMTRAFTNHEDIHVSTAAKIFKVPETEVTPAMRNSAKTANFGIIYGISSFGLSQRLNISRTEATALIQGYFESFPQVREYMDSAIKVARERGYVETIMGRRRFLPDIRSANAIVRGVAERNAINAPIQGSAADIIKMAMVNIQIRLKGNFHTRMILQVHDELIFDVPLGELEYIRELVKYEMEHVLPLQVPLIVDMGSGKNWLEAH
jgi:DNA polymerase-1